MAVGAIDSEEAGSQAGVIDSEKDAVMYSDYPAQN
jgi:hypothetical protein